MKTQHQNESELPQQVSTFEKISNSIIAKLLIILILLLLLLIPMSWVKDLISERKLRDESVKVEIAGKWGGPQVISGPVIGIPYNFPHTSNISDEKGRIMKETLTDEDYIFIVPKSMKVYAQVEPEYLSRGIYRSVVYNSDLYLSGEFDELDLKKLGVDPAKVKWTDAKIFIGMSDTKGLKANPTMQIGLHNVAFEGNTTLINLFERTMSVSLDLSSQSTVNKFDIHYELRGSKSLNVFPLADQNQILVEGKWSNPSFNGSYLPENRDVNLNEFRAEWNIPSFDRKFPHQWANHKGALYQIVNNYEIVEDTVVPSTDNQVRATEKDMVQVNFLEAINNYQQTTRVAKYGLLVILLTFSSLFFTEIIKKRHIHIIQYILIGCAMVLFYSLLLAFGEHVVFNTSYLISFVATTALISAFIYWITKDKKICLLFSGILTLFYGFIFVLMQLQDFSLLVGTIGIFIILAVMMRLSTKINWNQFDRR
ncbi:cell envelope integrity protein CreD [Sphingobacterium sp. SGG-5]|uniref:cell envelope integrity protein CreD n=1 Tax=Sphingobacterium sp. SGG-5 TaxID=2710881 RepID=UPI0013E9CC37|nr:cell envelope integrity protein CreD [Sphingobacterium sp. SGG-5]NGM62793.1 cell envelope integrity protein CreD [Sphingobacterium sp. SGG-5]